MKKLFSIIGLLGLLLASPAFADIFAPGGGGGGGSNHNILSSTHSDSTASAGTLGDIIRFNTTWERLGIGSAGQCLVVTAGLPAWGACTAGGAPSGATYITQVADGTLTNEQALGALATGVLFNSTTTGVLSIYVGTTCTNQFVRALSTAAVATCNTVSLTADVTGTLPVGNGGTGITSLGSGVATWLGTPSSANLAAAVTGETGTNALVFGTSPTLDSPLFTTKINVPRVTAFPGSPSTGDVVIVTDDSATGACDSAAGAALTICYWNGSAWVSLGDGNAGGGTTVTAASTFGTDNRVLRSDGTGRGAQSSGCTLSDTDQLTCPGGFIAGVVGTGVYTMLEGTPPGAGTNTGEHNLYFDSSDSRLKSHENGGTVQTYAKTNDTLAAFAATTSTELAGVLSDENGSAGGFMRATSPTITTPTISGAVAWEDGTRQTFNPNGTNAGLNIGSQAGLVGSPQNGDMWYDSTGNKYKCRENGVTVDCISTGAGSGDLTDVVAGTGIAVATPGGPAPTVSWSPSTQVASFTLFDAANASRTITFGLSGATDPVLTVGNDSVDFTTGQLKEAGNDVFTTGSGEINAVTSKATPTTSDLLLIEDAAASNAKKKSTIDQVHAANDARTKTLTNTTIDCEGTGNLCTIPRRYWFPAAGCNNTTAGSIWDLPSASPAVAACVTGTNTQKGVLDFADGSNLSAQITLKLPSTWAGTVDINVKWFSATTTGDVVWQTQTICVADAETDDPSFNTADAFAADTTKGTTNQTNDASDTAITVTGCAAGELLHLKLFRDSAHASDTMAGTARLIGAELIIREAI